MGNEIQLTASVEGLYDGILNRFLVCAGPGQLVQQIDPSDAKVLLGLNNVDNVSVLSAPTTEPVEIGTLWRNPTTGVLAVSVGIPPAITTQPTAQVVSAGATATFTTSATNATGYQWQKDSGSGFSNISGATSASYTTPVTVLADDADIFRCVVAGPAGPTRTTTTNAVTLSVLNPYTPIVLSPDFWYRAQSESLSNNANVTAWNDLSGNARHLTEATNPPLYKTSINNSRAAVLFDGTNDRLVATTYTGSGTAFTISGIFNSLSTAALQVWFSGTSTFYFAELATTDFHRARIGSVNTDTLFAARDWYPLLIRGNGTSLEVYEGKNRVAVGTIVATPLRFEGLSNRGAANWWNGYIQEIVAKNAALSDSDASNLQGYMLYEAGLPDAKTIVCDGDSLTFGLRSTGGLTFPAQMETLYGTTVARVYNHGVSGQTLVQMQSDAVAQDDRYAKRLDGASVKLVAWGGTNDINLGADATTALASLVTFCTNRRAAGFKVVVCTMISRGSFDATKEGYRTTFNTSVRANWASYADAICDLAADSRLSTNTDTTYFDADTVHLNNTGYGVVAALVKTTLDTIA